MKDGKITKMLGSWKGLGKRRIVMGIFSAIGNAIDKSHLDNVMICYREIRPFYTEKLVGTVQFDQNTIELRFAALILLLEKSESQAKRVFAEFPSFERNKFKKIFETCCKYDSGKELFRYAGGEEKVRTFIESNYY